MSSSREYPVYMLMSDEQDYVNANIVCYDNEEYDKYIKLGAVIITAGQYKTLGPNSMYINGSIVEGKPKQIPMTPQDAVEVKKLRLNNAAAMMGPLLDAVELGIATDEEKTKLLEWRTYRVLLNRIDTSKAPDINWPEKPS